MQGASRRRLDGRGAAARQALPTVPLSGTGGGPAPRPGWKSPQPICPARGATSVRGVRPSTSLECKPDGGGDQARQPESSLSSSAGEQGRGGRGRHDRRRPVGLDRLAQGRSHGIAAGRNVSTAAGARGGNPQARRRGAAIGHPDRGGSSRAASHPAGAGENPGPDVLDFKLRLSAGTRRS
jgi:hypothetical protein